MRRRLWLISPEGFSELHHGCLLSFVRRARIATAVRCVPGRGPQPGAWPVVRLLRLLRCGDLGTLHDKWSGWTINRLGLHAPAGRIYREARHAGLVANLRASPPGPVP